MNLTTIANAVNMDVKGQELLKNLPPVGDDIVEEPERVHGVGFDHTDKYDRVNAALHRSMRGEWRTPKHQRLIDSIVSERFVHGTYGPMSKIQVIDFHAYTKAPGATFLTSLGAVFDNILRDYGGFKKELWSVSIDHDNHMCIIINDSLSVDTQTDTIRTFALLDSIFQRLMNLCINMDSLINNRLGYAGQSGELNMNRPFYISAFDAVHGCVRLKSTHRTEHEAKRYVEKYKLWPARFTEINLFDRPSALFDQGVLVGGFHTVK